MRKPSRKSLKTKLDRIVREIVLLRDKGCVLADSTCTQVRQAGHLFSRVNLSTRWDLQNVFEQCSGHNMRHESDPVPFYKWYINKFGQKSFDDLYALHTQVAKFTQSQLEELYQQLKIIKETMEGK